MRFQVLEYVRWEDIDAAGIINYQAYLRFFGLAEAELFRSCNLSYRQLSEDLSLWLPRVRVECDFHRPVMLDQLLAVSAWFGRIGNTSIQLDFEVHRAEERELLVASGRYVLVCVDRTSFAPVPVPALLRERTSPYQSEGVPRDIDRFRR